MRIRKMTATAGTLAVLLAGLVAGPASADPVGCSSVTPSLTYSGSGYMTAYGSATCSVSETRTMYIEIKWDKTAAPDPLVAKNSKRDTAKYYNASVSSCDSGNTRGYYARSYFSSTASSQHDSSPKKITTCG